ncbi:MAG: DNA repair protein RecO [Candidatus Magasanikbacteria bacterium]
MESIVLSRRDSKENDQIIAVYTEECGKKYYLIRGVKKIGNKNSAHLEPFSFVQILGVPGKELDCIAKVLPIDYFSHIRMDFEKSIFALFVVSFLEKFFDSNQPEEKVFFLLYRFLKHLDSVSQADVFVLDIFFLQLFHRLGFAPELEYCISCGDGVENIKGDICGFHVAEGGFLCENCKQKIFDKNEGVLVIPKRMLQSLKSILKASWKENESVKYSEEEKRVLHTIIFDYIQYQSEKPIRDWKGLVE